MEVTNPEFEMEVSPAKADPGDKLGSNVDSVDAIDVRTHQGQTTHRLRRNVEAFRCTL
jgi:hypothetical protein